MVKFTVNLADVPIEISALYEKTFETYLDYKADDRAFFCLEVTEQIIKHEREKLASYPYGSRFLTKPLPLGYFERLYLYHQIGERLPEYGALLFHGSAVAVDGDAYLFIAAGGTGKSTHTRLWLQYFGDRAVMINDDKPILKFKDNNVFVCGSPWTGKHRLGANISAPLKGLCLLSRDSHNTIVHISGGEIFSFLFKQCYNTEKSEHTAQTLSLLERLTQCVPMYRLGCNMEPEAAHIAYMGMNEGVNL